MFRVIEQKTNKKKRKNGIEQTKKEKEKENSTENAIYSLEEEGFFFTLYSNDIPLFLSLSISLSYILQSFIHIIYLSHSFSFYLFHIQISYV